MAIKGKCSCYENSAPDEPLFVLAARDRLAPRAVRVWAANAEQMGVNKDKVKEARDLAAQMEMWQMLHGSKLPD